MDIPIDDDCAAIVSEMAVYDVRTAVALWCAGGKDHNVILENMKPVGESGASRIIYNHPYISCVDARSRLIVSLMEKGLLPYGRKDAEPEEGHIAYEKRHFKAKHLKAYLEQHYPNEKPAFLFGQIERARSAGISPDEYTALVVERDLLKARVNKGLKLYEEKQKEVAELKKQLAARTNPSVKAEENYLRIIAALLDCIKQEGAFDGFNYESEAKLRDFISTKYDGYRGLSSRHLAQVFAEAKKLID